MKRLVRSRSGLAALGLVAVGAAAAAALASGRTALGAALAVLDLAVASALILMAVVRLEWLQRTHHRALRDALRATTVPVDAAPAPTASAPAPAAGLVIGRDAARSPVARSRPELLDDLGFGAARGDAGTRPLVAGVVTDGLATALEPVVELVRLQPWLTVGRLEELSPSCLVIEERALREGAWFGVEGTTTLGLTTELEAVLAWCRREGIPVLGIRSEDGGGVSTPVLRSSYGLGFPAATEDLSPSGIPVRPFHRVLQEYSTGTTAGLL